MPAKIWIIRLLSWSTRLTAEIEACPTRETISESARPTVIVSSCSSIRGMISALSICRVKTIRRFSFVPVSKERIRASPYSNWLA